MSHFPHTDSSNASNTQYSQTDTADIAVCEQFMLITHMDRDSAMRMLQQNGWDLQQALDTHLNAQSNQQYQPSVVARASLDASHRLSNEKDRFKLLSWNIDGLDEHALELRTLSVVDTIKREKPDAVFLQEVVRSSLQIIEASLPEYESHLGNSQGYFVTILTRRDSLTVLGFEVIAYPCTRMGRNLLLVQTTYKNCIGIDLMTSHHESGTELLASQERMEQLKACFGRMVATPADRVVLFGGDLNMRQRELQQVGNVPSGVSDLWVATGAPPECEFTWDMKLNTNKNFSMASNKPRARFDRLYYRPSANRSLQFRPISFELKGLEKISPIDRFCSDHWGIQVSFDV